MDDILRFWAKVPPSVSPSTAFTSARPLLLLPPPPLLCTEGGGLAQLQPTLCLEFSVGLQLSYSPPPSVLIFL